MKELLIATTNEGKKREFIALTDGLPISVLTLKDLSGYIEAKESGASFLEIASAKAVEYACQSGIVTLADDSGLSVDALNGRPGILSARYGGESLSFGEKMDLLLDEIASAANGTDIGRTAHFTAAVAIASPDGKILQTSVGITDGTIASAPRGTNGFGYDPLFIPDGSEKTFGEMSNDEKSAFSHRTRSFSALIPFLRDFSGF